MDHFTVKEGKVQKLTKEEYENQPKGRHISDVMKDMTPEELERFQKERYEKFILPLMEHNQTELKNNYNKK